MLKKAALCLAGMILAVAPAQAQLNQTFTNLFDEILVQSLALSPGPHGQHFLQAALEANNQLSPALNSMIASNVSSFPLSTTVAGVTFDFSTGQPVPIVGSQGPILAESAETLGDRKFVVGFNATHLSLNSIRGIPLEEMRFTFLHEDVNSSGILGDNVNESDLIDIFPGLDVDANIFALYATFGVGRNLDVSIAIPFVDISLKGNSRAVVNSFTLGALGEANHHFGDTSTNPELTQDQPYDRAAAGIGDIALRFKWRFPFKTAAMSTGLLLDVRVPTGDEVDYLGTGTVSARALILASKKIGDFTPHLNVGVDYRSAHLDSDEVEIILGFDQKITNDITFALDFLAELDIQKSEAIKLLPGNILVIDRVPGTDNGVERSITRSNIPDRNFDNTINAAVGFKVAPSERLLFMGNLLIPLQDDGLRSSIAPTVGFSVSF